MKTLGYYASCACEALVFYADTEGARVAQDGHVCKPAKVERTRCDCEPISGGCKKKAVHR